MTQPHLADIEREMQQVEALEKLAAATDLPDAPAKENPFGAGAHHFDVSLVHYLDANMPVVPEIDNQPPGWVQVMPDRQG